MFPSRSLSRAQHTLVVCHAVQHKQWVCTWGAFSHGTTAPIITLFVPGTPLKNTHLPKHACPALPHCTTAHTRAYLCAIALAAAAVDSPSEPLLSVAAALFPGAEHALERRLGPREALTLPAAAKAFAKLETGGRSHVLQVTPVAVEVGAAHVVLGKGEGTSAGGCGNRWCRRARGSKRRKKVPRMHINKSPNGNIGIHVLCGGSHGVFAPEEACAIACVHERQSARSAGRKLARQWPTRP